MHQAHLQQLECLSVLAEELHFGRAARRLGCSQSRVSQLVAALEQRVGVRLVDRTSRRVTFTAAGVHFLDEVGPAYQCLVTAFERASARARRGVPNELAIGFTGLVYENVACALRALTSRRQVTIQITDVPLGTPFTSVLDGQVDAVIAELPVHEPSLVVGHRFAPQDQYLALAAEHPMALADSIGLEDLAHFDVLHRTGGAPDYWRAARTPAHTPSGVPIASTMGISTLQQGITLTASGPYAMLVCGTVAERHTRPDIRFVPVRGLERSSQLAVIWRSDNDNDNLAVLAQLLSAQSRESR